MLSSISHRRFSAQLLEFANEVTRIAHTDLGHNFLHAQRRERRHGQQFARALESKAF